MGMDSSTGQLHELTEEQARTWTKGPVFYTGEEVTLKGVPFTIVDIAPGQLKLKPKRQAVGQSP
jgi:hypothetical protein